MYLPDDFYCCHLLRAKQTAMHIHCILNDIVSLQVRLSFIFVLFDIYIGYSKGRNNIFPIRINIPEIKL